MANEAVASQRARGIAIRSWDVAFLVLAVATLAGIAALGVGSYRAAHDLEQLKRNAEHVVARLEAIAATRGTAAADPAACARHAPGATPAGWSACLSAIRSEPDIAAFANGFVAGNQAFGKACSTEDPAARGTIVFEKGTEWFSAGTTGTSFAPVADEEAIDRELVLRVRVCGRWGEPVTVREVRF
jgi:hypothetical protein